MDYPAQRRDRLARCLVDEGLDALLVSSPVNVTYLTGFTGDTSVLVLARDQTLLVSDMRFTAQLAEECPELALHVRPPSQKLLDAVAQVLARLGARAVGFESAAVTVAELEQLRELAPTVQWKGGGDRVERLRMVKDEVEVAALREAIDVAERAFAAFCALLRPDDTEKDLCDRLDHFVRRCGGQGACFPPIVAVGERSALPHAPPTGRRIDQADFVLVDWGATGRNLYKSDLTRVLDTRTTSTFFEAARQAPAAPRRQLERIHAAVLEAQRRAIQAVRPGVPAQAVDAAARSCLADAGLGEHFGHGLGHGIGLQVHEGPAVRPGSETVLETGMVFTIEPGVYLPGWGGVRIEDDVLVTPDGCEVLTHVSRELGPAAR
jgi:Xaa-Pro aminopeptidase